MFNNSRPAVALFVYVVAFALALFLFLRGFQTGAVGLLVIVWAVLVLWLRKGRR